MSKLPTEDRVRVRSIEISNFRSIGRDVRVRLEDLTVLVGPNGSGKSNIVDALRFLADAMTFGLGGAIDARNGIESCRRWNRSSGGNPNRISLCIDLSLPDGGTARYSIALHGSKMQEYWVEHELAEVRRDGQSHRLEVRRGRVTHTPEGLAPEVDERSLALPLVGADRRFRVLYSTIRSFAAYAIYPNTLRAAQAPSSARPMATHGENWASILKDQAPETWKSDLVAALGKLTGDIDDVRVERLGGQLIAEFHRTVQKAKMTSGKWFGAYQESDGTLRVAGIITALLQLPTPSVICIEEPELTVHPGVIQLIHDFLVQASRTTQVIVTTHSPELLDLVRPEAIRVVARGVVEGTTVANLHADQREEVRLRLMSLGDLLRQGGLQQELPWPDSTMEASESADDEED